MQKIALLHGSRTKFTGFSKEYGTRFSTGQSTLGHFLTDQAEYALLFSDPTIEEVADFLDVDDEMLDRTHPAFMQFAEENPGFIYRVEASFENMKFVAVSATGLATIDQMQLDFNDEDFARYRAELIEDGFDSVCFETNDGYSEYVFLDDRQIEIIEVFPADVFRMSSTQPALSL